MTTRVRRLADEPWAEAIHRLLASAGEAMARNGFHNWLPPYPLDRIRADIRDRHVFTVLDMEQLVATYTLRPTPAKAYVPELWPQPEVPALYLNRLAVHPARQGEGIGSWCLTSIAEDARAAGARAVRCDVLADNLPLRAFYERHGYVSHGTRTHSGWTFACYERRTDPPAK
jgi:ribosomal protein S18 acetylase RimI-like enzyme